MPHLSSLSSLYYCMFIIYSIHDKYPQFSPLFSIRLEPSSWIPESPGCSSTAFHLPGQWSFPSPLAGKAQQGLLNLAALVSAAGSPVARLVAPPVRGQAATALCLGTPEVLHQNHGTRQKPSSCWRELSTFEKEKIGKKNKKPLKKKKTFRPVNINGFAVTVEHTSPWPSDLPADPDAPKKTTVEWGHESELETMQTKTPI